ncbi:methyltransferase domain-containing protein [uncultured Paludibaculum sp.]|uniref:methyltransferase domain-containing protein n=1 Tax=uncultured Paludibaculum sp. TaxID=1765020 RepID=UPI002AAAE116|nr:methyltransferase domain-containing protein [uncultured Paludibaculum sp.]
MKILMLLLATATLYGQAADKANARYRTAEGREGMLTSLGAPDRPNRIHAETIVKILKIQPGQTVADIGTGAGALLSALTPAVGPTGHVYAEDIFDDFLSAAKKRHAAATNIKFVLGSEKDVKLPAGCCDVAVTVDAYHHYDYPAEMLASIRKALKPGGKFAVVDYYRRPGAMGPGGNPMEHIRIDKDAVIKEVQAQGFKLLETTDTVENSQYIAVFSR